MTNRPERCRFLSKAAGWLYLYTMLTGIFAEFYVAGLLIVSGDPRATAANILASETLFRMSIVNEILGVAAYVAVSGLLYVLLKSAGKNLAFASVLFATVGNALWVVGALYQFGALRLLHGGAQLRAFTAHQVQALALQSLELHDAALNVGMMFFGIYCVLIGILMFRSASFPRTIGALLAIGGTFDLLTACLTQAFAVGVPDLLSIPGFIGEATLTAWLIAVGVTTAIPKEKKGRHES